MVKFKNIPIINNLIQFLKKIKPNSFYGFSFYDILRMYIIGIIKPILIRSKTRLISPLKKIIKTFFFSFLSKKLYIKLIFE